TASWAAKNCCNARLPQLESAGPYSYHSLKGTHYAQVTLSVQAIGVHADRATGGDRHYRYFDRIARAGRTEGARGRRADAVLQQRQAIGTGGPQLSRHLPEDAGGCTLEGPVL